jgi:hypothetical protein
MMDLFFDHPASTIFFGLLVLIGLKIVIGAVSGNSHRRDCPRCGAKQARQAKFCTRCGAPLQTPPSES